MSVPSRRNALKQMALLIAAIPLALIERIAIPTVEAGEPALPAGAQAISESDPVASALGFHHDAKKTDFAKYPNRKKPDAKNQICKNCALYTPANDGWGKCTMLTAGLVSSKGWCGSWSKKA